MSRDKDQQLMFNKDELRLIKSVFGDNDELLYAIRKVLLQFPLTDKEKEALRTQLTPEVYAVVKKRIFPDLDPDAPFGQLGDFFQTLSQDLNSKGVEEMRERFAAKDLQIQYLDQQFSVLKDIDAPIAELLRLDDMKRLKGKDDISRYVDTISRNFLLGYVDGLLNMLKVLAGTKEETVEEQQERITRNSNK